MSSQSCRGDCTIIFREMEADYVEIWENYDCSDMDHTVGADIMLQIVHGENVPLTCCYLLGVGGDVHSALHCARDCVSALCRMYRQDEKEKEVLSKLGLQLSEETQARLFHEQGLLVDAGENEEARMEDTEVDVGVELMEEVQGESQMWWADREGREGQGGDETRASLQQSQEPDTEVDVGVRMAEEEGESEWWTDRGEAEGKCEGAVGTETHDEFELPKYPYSQKTDTTVARLRREISELEERLRIARAQLTIEKEAAELEEAFEMAAKKRKA